MSLEPSVPPKRPATPGSLSHIPSRAATSPTPSIASERVPAPGVNSSQYGQIPETDLIAATPLRPSPVFSVVSSRTPSFSGSTVTASPIRGSWAEEDRDVEKTEPVCLDLSKHHSTTLDNKALIPPSSAFTTTFDVKHESGAYLVENLHPYDDHEHLSPLQRFCSKITPLTMFLSVGSYFNYFVWRIIATRDEEKLDRKVYLLAWFFIAAEALIAIPGTFQNSWLIISARGRHRPQLRLTGLFAPTVDVLITCCREDIDVVLDTTRAACGVDYPTDRFRVVVLDDGADADLQKAVEDLREQHPNLYYHARVKTKGVPHHAKAGNLIGGTAMVTKLDGGPGEFIAALDADMIPQPEWLRAIVAHAIQDQLVSLVCPPQLFYNIPPDDPLVQSLEAFVHVIEPAKDATGVAWCTGSGYIVRRSALEAIGGWPTGSLAEDVCTSSLLLGAGWKTVYCHEPLQYGLVPDTYTGHLKQRTRWTLGTLQTACKLRFFLFSPLIRKMTFFQRLSGFVFSIDALFKIFYPIAIATIPVVLVAGKKLVAYVDEQQLRWLIRWCLVMLATQRLNEWVMFIPSGYRLGRHEGRSIIWMAPYHAITVIRSFLLPSWLGGKTMAFAPSGSLKSELNERDPARRAPLWRRLKIILWDCKALFHITFIVFTVAAVALSTARAFLIADRTTMKVLESLLTHAFWPPVAWVLMILALWSPIMYAINPPNMPDREEMLDRDPITGIAHPKQAWKDQRWTATNNWHEFWYTLVTVYTAFLFVGTFVHWRVDGGGKLRFFFKV